jgi:hypothetical protein
MRALWSWGKRWQMTLVLVAITAVFVLSVWGLANQARESRDANVRFCEGGNERTAVILDFILRASADPDPRQFEFITDPVLRQGALDQARRGRAEQRARALRTFTARNCNAEFPP